MDFVNASNINASQPQVPDTIKFSFCKPGADADGNVVLHRMPDGDCATH